MKGGIKFLICAVFFLVLAIPMLRFFGFKESWTTLVGTEKKVIVPSVTCKNLENRSFQSAAEEFFAKNFFMRKAALKTRNQLYEYLDFGLFHEGYGRQVVEGRDGFLFEKGYVMMYYSSYNLTEKYYMPAIRILKELQSFCAQHEIDFVFVMAPDKAQMYAEQLPSWACLWDRKTEEIQSQVECFLNKHGIVNFNAFQYLADLKGKFSQTFFPISGTHWNALAAALTVDEILRMLNDHSGSAYRLSRFKGVKESKSGRYSDHDIGTLLNLWNPVQVKRNIAYTPNFSSNDFIPNCGSVLVFGDSFTLAPTLYLRDSKLFSQGCVYQADKRNPTADEFGKMAHDLRLIMLVFQPPNTKALPFKVDRLSALLAGLKSAVSNKGERTYEQIPITATSVFASGFSSVSFKERWSDARWAVCNFVLPQKLRGNTLVLSMEVRPFLMKGRVERQRFSIEVDGVMIDSRVLAKPGWQRINVVLSQEHTQSRNLSVGFNFPDAVVPKELGYNADPRLLAVSFRNLSLVSKEKEDKQ